MHIGVLPACVSMHYMYNWYLWKLQEGIRSPRNEATDDLSCHVDYENQT